MVGNKYWWSNIFTIRTGERQRGLYKLLGENRVGLMEILASIERKGSESLITQDECCAENSFA